jgi:hypothetical protein
LTFLTKFKELLTRSNKLGVLISSGIVFNVGIKTLIVVSVGGSAGRVNTSISLA